jgi:hypothetical protein
MVYIPSSVQKNFLGHRFTMEVVRAGYLPIQSGPPFARPGDLVTTNMAVDVRSIEIEWSTK